MQARPLAKANPHMLLSSLPAELIEQIASYLDLETFRSFRLTSTRYHTQTTHTFRRRFFTTHFVQWSRRSLQRIVDISAYPGLGSTCHHLIIDATPHHALALWKMRRRSADAGHMTPITDDEDGSKLVKRLSEDYDTLQQRAETLTRWFNETRFDVKCLTVVFSRLTSLEGVTFAYKGMGAQYSKFGGRYCEISQHEMSRPFISTLSALAASKSTVKYIKLHDEHSYGAISIGRLESLAPSLRSFATSFESLDTLQLNLRDWRTPDLGFEIESSRAPFVVRLLAKCVNVTVLELSCFSSLEDNLFGEIVRTCRFAKLERCRLDSFRLAHTNDLLKFLLNSSKSLRELHLRHILNADSEATWIEFFRSVADSAYCLTSLHTLSAIRLFSQRDHGLVKRIMFHRVVQSAYCLFVEGNDWHDQLRDGRCNYVELEAARMWDAGATMYPFT